MTGFCPTVPGASAGRTQKLRVTVWLRSSGNVLLLALRLAVCWDLAGADGLTPTHSIFMWFLLLGFFKCGIRVPKSNVLEE